jgi:hypothetical protein
LSLRDLAEMFLERGGFLPIKRCGSERHGWSQCSVRRCANTDGGGSDAAGMSMRPCATRRAMCMVREHLPPAVGRQAYPPNLKAEPPRGEGPPGETTGSTGAVADP